MHNNGNVVPFRKASTDQAIHSPLVRLPVILLQVRDKAAQQLRQGLQALFDNADDTLFEMADRARNDLEQNIFFQAMRDLRLKRKSIERFFFEQFFEAFISLTRYSATHMALPQAETCTPLCTDELERNVAVEAMVNKVLSRDGFALDQLTARLSTLLGRSLMEQHNPIGPTMLCEYFLQAGRSLGVEIKVKLIILKLFDRYVLTGTDQLYADANRLLVATGVLSDLKPAPTGLDVELASESDIPPIDEPALAIADEEVIGLITLVFERLCDDRNLPDAVKALIGRLQTPVVKVALLDKRFFSRSTHPARRLLNEIARAAVEWSGCDAHERDSLYLHIEQVVQRLLNDFVEDPAIFSELLTDFLAFTGEERRRCELLEQRTRDAEEGRAQSVLARRRVEQVLNQALVGRVLPRAVVVFVHETWSKVLLLTCLKHGDQSAQWCAAVLTMEQLIWSVERHEEPGARARLLALVPDLLKALREGLNGSAFDPFATSEFFTELATLHAQLFEPLPHGAQAGSLMVEVLEELVLPGADNGAFETVPVQLPVDDEGLRQVDRLHPGCWVEFQDDAGNPLRCKLAAIVEASGQYVFVNRSGLKVLERSRSRLALEFRRGAVRALDDTLLFDRALESAIGHLQRLNHAK